MVLPPNNLPCFPFLLIFHNATLILAVAIPNMVADDRGGSAVVAAMMSAVARYTHATAMKEAIEKTTFTFGH